MASDAYRPRLIDQELGRLFAQLPAILLTGPRAAGKTTTAGQLARTIVRLDQDTEAAAFRADPDAVLRTLPEPVLLDEWQAVPGVLGAVKRAVDDDPRPGRFLLTGSVRAELEAETWPGTGRVVRMPLFGLSEREIEGRIDGQGFIDKLLTGKPDVFSLPATVPDLPGYIERAMRSGFPEPALRLEAEGRQAWLDGYLDGLLTRDVLLLKELRNPARLRRYFEALALKTADVTEHRSLYEAADINRLTAQSYDHLLMNLFVLEQLPAWFTNRLKRLVKAPKRYLVDAALATTALRLTPQGVLRDGDMFGRVLDTFAMAQLRPELALHPLRPRPYYFRDQDRREADIVIELATGILSLEVKAEAGPDRRAARHLEWLRDQLGDFFLGGAVLHTGPRSYPLTERILALPLCTLWG